MEVALIALFVIAAVALFVSIPLRPGAKGDEERIEDPERAELEARKESKYREIRDAELDREQGKLSQADWARADTELRREAIEILRAIDALPKRGRRDDPSL
jgi:hypothetical protein